MLRRLGGGYGLSENDRIARVRWLATRPRRRTCTFSAYCAAVLDKAQHFPGPKANICPRPHPLSDIIFLSKNQISLGQGDETSKRRVNLRECDEAGHFFPPPPKKRNSITGSINRIDAGLNVWLQKGVTLKKMKCRIDVFSSYSTKSRYFVIKFSVSTPIV